MDETALWVRWSMVGVSLAGTLVVWKRYELPRSFSLLMRRILSMYCSELR
jgi:hypothetical protein